MSFTHAFDILCRGNIAQASSFTKSTLRKHQKSEYYFKKAQVEFEIHIFVEKNT